MDAKSLAIFLPQDIQLLYLAATINKSVCQLQKNILTSKTGMWKVPNMNSYDQIHRIGPQEGTHKKKPLVLV